MKVISSAAMTRRRLPRTLPMVMAALVVLCMAIHTVIITGPAAHAAATLLSQGKPTTASSTENATFPASAATDGNTGTRWSSGFSDPQWIQVDLGSSASVSQVVLNWEAAFGKSFQIQTSNDAANWTTIFSTTTGTGGIQTLNVTGTGRFVRMNGTARGTAFGYSLWEFGIFTTGGSPPPPTTTTGPTTTVTTPPGSGAPPASCRRRSTTRPP